MISKNKISLFDLSMRLLPWVNNESESVGVETDSSRTSSNLDKRLGDLSVLSLFVLVRIYKSRGLRTCWWNDETRRIGCVAAGLAGRRARLEFKGSECAMIDAQLVACRAESWSSSAWSELAIVHCALVPHFAQYLRDVCDSLLEGGGDVLGPCYINQQVDCSCPQTSHIMKIAFQKLLDSIVK